MEFLDWLVLGLYFIILILIGVYAYRRINSSADFFTAGGKLPWWLSGVSHHVSGYSGAVFVAYAGIAYTHGFTLYVWWAGGVATATLLAALFVAPKWTALRIKYSVQSPTEYLLVRYNLKTQQTIAWSGVLIKVFDIGGKLAAIAVLLNIFTGSPLVFGIILAGSVSLIYITVGGLWADVWNDFAQFIVQIIAGVIMFIAILIKFDKGISGIIRIWDYLPDSHSSLFNEPYTFAFAFSMLIINFFSYSGGTWNLAARFISSSSPKEAKRAGLLSSALYLFWPLILLFPMFAAPFFFPNMEDPTLSYGVMALNFLPKGLIGLVLASMFANTLSMTSSDSNTVSAVITRDILPVIFPGIKKLSVSSSLKVARLTTFLFTVLTIIIAINYERFGGVFGLIVSWFAALLGPIAVPVILGLLKIFRKSGSIAALISIIFGLAVFILTKIIPGMSLALEVGLPIIVSLFVYILSGLIRPEYNEQFEN